MSQINFQSLEDFVATDVGDDMDGIQNWYEKLSEYELEGNETPQEMETLLNAMRYLLSFSFTAAEELREIAEKEASQMADKEEAWEEQKQELKEELASLRERIIVRADAGESSEAFRAQIDSLKDENRQLQQVNRDRDREMADQRDRFESLVLRVESLTRERDALQDHRSQMEDTIRELNRRISSKTEGETNEWEARKLRLRNEQAVTLSRQIQAATEQNEEIREDAERAWAALEEANQLIKQNSDEINSLQTALESSIAKADQFSLELRITSEQLNEKSRIIEEIELDEMKRQQILKRKIEEQAADIERLTEEFYAVRVDNEQMRAQLAADQTLQKEEELDKLKLELIDATKMARTLFGHTSAAKDTVETGTDLRLRIVQLEEFLREANEKIESYRKASSELEDIIVQKDMTNGDISTELERLKQLKFGDARSEIDQLSLQLRIRDEQITRLTNHCTLLHIELGRYSERVMDTQPTALKAVPTQPIEVSTEEYDSESVEDSADTEIMEEKVPSPKKPEVLDKPNKTKRIKVIREVVHVERSAPRSTEEYEQSAVLIAGLYYEIMRLLEEVEMKNNLLLEMDNTVRHDKKDVDLWKARLKVAYEEISTLKEKAELDDSPNTIVEETKQELFELRRLSETIRMNGNEIERRAEESTRKLIAQKLLSVRMERSIATLQKRCLRSEKVTLKIRKKLVNKEVQLSRKCARLQLEVDTMCLDMGLLQNKLLKSVPQEDFESLSRKYRRLLKDETIKGGTEEREMETSSINVIKLHDMEGVNMVELEQRNEHLKKMVTILSDQNEFWSKEIEMLQMENEELKRFMEDIENESDLKSLLAAIEQRLLETIREQQEQARDQTRDSRKKKDADEILSRDRMKWMGERRHLMQIITVLQHTLQITKGSSIDMVTIEQMETFRGEILKTRQRQIDIEHEEKKITELRTDLDTQQAKLQASQKTRESIQTEGADIQRLERTLQYAYTATSVEMSKTKKLDNTIRQKDRLIEELNLEAEKLRRANDEYLKTICSASVLSLSGEKTSEQKTPRDQNQSIIREVEEKEETDYEMDFDSSESQASSDRVIVRTIVQDNSKELNEKLRQMKSYAEECIRGYKEQLEQKDAAIDHYREILLSKMSEVVSVRESKRDTPHGEERPTDENSEMKINQLITENIRMKREIEDLEAANSTFFRRRKSQLPPPSIRIHSSQQTDPIEIESHKEQETSRSDMKSERIESHLNTEDSDERLFEKLEEKPENRELLRLRSEVRSMKARLARLSTINKELVAACEKIKNDAIAQLDANNQGRVTESVTVAQSSELDKLRSERRHLLQTVEELRKRIVILQNEKETLNKGKDMKGEQVRHWEEKKKLESTVASLKKRLKDTTDREEELKDRLDKREKRVDEMRRELELKQREVEKANRRLKDVITKRDSLIRDNQSVVSLQQRCDTAELEMRKMGREMHIFQTEIKRENAKYQEVKKELERIRTQTTKDTVSTTRSVVTTISTSQPRPLPSMPLIEMPDSTASTSVRQEVSSRQKESSGYQRMQERNIKMEKEMDTLREKLKKSEASVKEQASRLRDADNESSVLTSRIEDIEKKLRQYQENPWGAVQLLGDKLQAKDREISQLKSKILSLERRLSQ